MSVLASSCSNEPGAPAQQQATQPRDQTAPSETAENLIGFAPRASGGFASVIIFEPQPPIDFPVPQDPAVMDQYNTDFHPRLLVVRVGQTVQFKNSEDTLHNVHVIDTVTRDTAFNVATPVTGSYDYVFETASIFDVSCGVHPSMAAIIVVTETPYTAVAELDGTFELTRPPRGDYTATVWNLDRSRRTQRLVTIDDETAELDFTTPEPAQDAS